MASIRSRTALCATTTLLLSVLLVPLATDASQLGATSDLMFKTITASQTIAGGSVVALTANGNFQWPMSKAGGKGGSRRDKPIGYDSCINMNTMVEVLVAYAAINLQVSTQFTNSLDNAIDTKYLPSGVRLLHPTHNIDITYRMLMMHTSTITDALFDARIRVAPNAVETLTTFVENYFTVAGGTLNPAVFGTQSPGTATAFSHARANTALLAYVLERVIVDQQQQFDNLKDYISKSILTPFGMTSTFWLETDGSAPGVTPTPSFTGTYNTINAKSSGVYSPFFSGCIVDQLASTVQIHPAFSSDYMGYTTVQDMARLARALMVDVNFQNVANLMRGSPLRFSTNTAGSLGQSGQSSGLMMFNGDDICVAARQTRVISDCPVTNQTDIFGYAATRGSSMVGFFCANGGTRTGFVCMAAGFVYSGNVAAGFAPLYSMAGATFQEAFGTVNIVTPAPPAPLRDGLEAELFGVYVFIGAFGTALLVFFGTMGLQYLLLPPALAPTAQTVATNAVVVPSAKKVSPPRDVEGGASARRSEGGSPPRPPAFADDDASPKQD